LLPVFVGVCVLVGVCVGVSVLLGVCVGVTAAGVGVGDGVGVGVAHPNEITTPLNMSVLVYPEPIKVESTKTLNGPKAFEFDANLTM
jgi:hypothetical protein